MYLHRFLCLALHGPDAFQDGADAPSKLEAMHTPCQHPFCMLHIEAGTHARNMEEWGAAIKGKLDFDEEDD